MKHYLGACTWGIIVLYLCLKPGNQIPLPALFQGADKLAHCGFFFIFTSLLLYGAIKNSKTKKFSWISLFTCATISFVLAVLTEFLQWKIFTYRQAELWDMFANIIGIGMASFTYILFYPKKPTTNN